METQFGAPLKIWLPRRTWGALLWIGLLALLSVDLRSPPEFMLVGFFLLPSLVAAAFFPSRQVAWLSVAAFAATIISGWNSGVLPTVPYLVHLAASAAIGASAVVLATARERQAASAECERQRLRGTLESLLDPLILLSGLRDDTGKIADFIIAEANDAACLDNRMPRGKLIGARLLELLPKHPDAGLFSACRNVVETGTPLILNDYLYPHDVFEEPRFYDIRGAKAGDSLSYTWREVTGRHQISAALEQRVRTDELTKLLNRRGMLEKLRDLRDKTPRTGRNLAVLFVDFDKFKDVNDTYGHAAGDEVLRATADRIRACLRHSDDLGARVGGDEMMVVLHGVHGMKDAAGVAEKLRRSAAAPVRYDGVSVAATVSVGVTLARPDESIDALVARADAAMYEAKQRGRNQVITIKGPPSL